MFCPTPLSCSLHAVNVINCIEVSGLMFDKLKDVEPRLTSPLLVLCVRDSSHLEAFCSGTRPASCDDPVSVLGTETELHKGWSRSDHAEMVQTFTVDVF